MPVLKAEVDLKEPSEDLTKVPIELLVAELQSYGMNLKNKAKATVQRLVGEIHAYNSEERLLPAHLI